MSDIKQNKTFQFIVGAGTLWVAWALYRDGWLSWMFNGRDESGGFSNTQLWLAIGSALISFVQLIGICTIGVVSGVLPHATVFVEWAVEQIKKLIEKLKAGASKDKPDWDWRPLAAIVLSYVLWTGGQLQDIWSLLRDAFPQRIVETESTPEFLVFSSNSESATDGQLSVSSSLLVEEMLEAKGVERRSYDSSQEAINAEPWISQAMNQSPDEQSNMILIYPSGKAEIREIPSSVSEMEDIISAW